MTKFSPIGFGRIIPDGWLKELMSSDLENGFIGHLDELLPTLFLDDDIFGRDRRTGGPKDMDLGLADVQAEVSAEYQWWNAESQSNWLDGFVRTVMLVGSAEMREKMERYIRSRLASQDADGYLGIYGPDLRYRQGSENGELWAQSALFRTLIAYCEATGNEDVLNAVMRAMRVTMAHYPIYKSKPFSTDKQKDGLACGGLAHGLTITDALFWLYKNTGDQDYLDYAAWLFDSCSAEPVFQSHGVQTFSIPNTSPLPARITITAPLRMHCLFPYRKTSVKNIGTAKRIAARCGTTRPAQWKRNCWFRWRTRFCAA